MQRKPDAPREGQYFSPDEEPRPGEPLFGPALNVLYFAIVVALIVGSRALFFALLPHHH